MIQAIFWTQFYLQLTPLIITNHLISYMILLGKCQKLTFSQPHSGPDHFLHNILPSSYSTRHYKSFDMLQDPICKGSKIDLPLAPKWDKVIFCKNFYLHPTPIVIINQLLSYMILCFIIYQLYYFSNVLYIYCILRHLVYKL